MKIIKPLKYVLTAAAVCILCFSGNGEYIYAVCTLTPENDIVEQPEQPDEMPGKCVKKNTSNKKELLKRLVKKYAVHNPENKVPEFQSFYQPVINNKISFIPNHRNIKLHQIFAAGIPGNRSP